MIVSFADPDTEASHLTGARPRTGWQGVAIVAARKLDMLNAATRLDDLRMPPGNMLEALRGDRAGQHSIRTTTSGASASYGPKRDPQTSGSSITTGVDGMTRVTTHPGEILRLEFLEPLGLSARALASAIHIPLTRVTGILEERRGVDADTAIRLGKVFGTSSEFWLNLQQAHDLSKARREGDFEGIEQVTQAGAA